MKKYILDAKQLTEFIKVFKEEEQNSINDLKKDEEIVQALLSENGLDLQEYKEPEKQPKLMFYRGDHAYFLALDKTVRKVEIIEKKLLQGHRDGCVYFIQGSDFYKGETLPENLFKTPQEAFDFLERGK